MRRLLTVLLSFIAFGASAQTTQLLGGPGIKVINRGDFQADSIFYLPRTLVTSRTPTQAGALRYQASDSTLYQWTGTAWRKAGGGDVDTLLLSTRAWRQKGDDSLAARINTRTDTLLIATRAWRQKGDDSLAARIATASDTNTLSTRAWRQKGIDSVASVRIGGSGVTGYIPKFTAASTLDSSQIFQSNGLIGIGRNNPQGILDIQQNTSGDAMFRVFNNNTASGTGKTFMRLAHNRTTVSFGNQMQFTDSLAFIGTIAGDRTNGMTFFTGATSGSTDNERMRINPSGNIAIGTTADNGYRVNVSGTMRTTGATWLGTSASTLGVGTTTFTTGATGFGQILASGSNGGIVINSDSGNINRLFFTRKNSLNDNEGLIRYNTGSLAMEFWTASLQRMTIFGNGRIGVNTTTDAGLQFDVNGTARTGTLTVNTNGQGRTISTNQASGTDGSNIFIGGAGASINGTSGSQSSYNTSLGSNALVALTTGNSNTSIGFESMQSNTTGSGNTAFGRNALRANTTANNNTSIGNTSMQLNTTGASNTAIGVAALSTNSTGSSNVAIGVTALGNNTTANNNVAIGFESLLTNSTGVSNTAIGTNSLRANTTANSNTAIGLNTMYFNTTGASNVAVGIAAMQENITGGNNSAIGSNALISNKTGSNNTAIGFEAGRYINSGANNDTANNSIYIGYDARSSANNRNNEVVIGYQGRGNGSNTTTIGNSSTTTTFLLGSLDVGTIDSSASPINMLWSDVNGVIRKAAIQGNVTMAESTATIETGWNFSRETTANTPISQVTKTSNGTITTVNVNIAVHRTTATFTEDTWVKVASLPAGYRPNNVIHGQLPSIVSGDQFKSQGNVAFTGDMKTSGHMAFRIQEDGDVQINVDQVTTSVDLSGANYVLFPITISFPILTIAN